MNISKETHPHIVKAFNLVDLDGGLDRLNPNLKTVYIILSSHDCFLADAEVELSRLSEDNLETFCTGEYDDIQAIATKYKMENAHTLIGDYFNGWEPDPDTI